MRKNKHLLSHTQLVIDDDVINHIESDGSSALTSPLALSTSALGSPASASICPVIDLAILDAVPADDDTIGYGAPQSVLPPQNRDDILLAGDGIYAPITSRSNES